MLWVSSDFHRGKIHRAGDMFTTLSVWFGGSKCVDFESPSFPLLDAPTTILPSVNEFVVSKHFM